MSCEGCNSKIKKDNEARETIQEKAQELANQTGEWFAIYKDEFGFHTIRADLSTGYPIIGHVSPNVQDAVV